MRTKGVLNEGFKKRNYASAFDGGLLINDYYDPGTGWWYDSGSSYGYYYDGDG